MKYFHLALFLAIVSSPAQAVDNDGDGADDSTDNCREVANDQCDTNLDGFGNLCDADLDNNCIVNSFDLSILRDNFGQTGTNDADLDCNGVVNSFDLQRMRQSFGLQPGPSNQMDCGCADPVVEDVPMRWVEPPRNGLPVANSHQVTRACDDGVLMTVTTQELLKDYTYTMWLGFFQNPHMCRFPPVTPHNPVPYLRCGMFDLFNPLADPNMRYGAGLVATGVDDVFEAYLATGAPPWGSLDHCKVEVEGNEVQGTLCQNDKLGWSLVDDDTGVLTAPRQAEYQAVLKSHGPRDPLYMPAQIETLFGGCHAEDDNGTPFDESDDTPAEPYFPCRDPQVAGAVSDIGAECLDDAVCLASLIASVGAPFVAGEARGRNLAGDRFSLTIAGRGERNELTEPDTAEGSFSFSHVGADGSLMADLTGVIDCITVSESNRALVLGTVTEPARPDPAIVFTIEDLGTDDTLSFSVPFDDGSVIVGTCEPQVVDVGVFEVQLGSGNFYVSD